MYKVSFKKDSKKVQTFNNCATVVTLVGELSLPKGIWEVIPKSINNWFWTHSGIETDWMNEDRFRIECSGKAVCAKDDTFDLIIGERIAESRAKVKLYSFMTTFLRKLVRYYSEITFGNTAYERLLVTNFNPNTVNISSSYWKYYRMLGNEKNHLTELLQNTK